MLQEVWAWTSKHWLYIGELVIDHIKIVFTANGIAAIIGVLLGIYISGRGREKLADTVLYLTGILLTIPSLAMYGFLMALLGAFGLPRIGFAPVVSALTLYGLLPIVRNTYTAIITVDPAVITAGLGMGMSDWELLTKIKLPLAIPVIMAGLRQAVVMNVGIATIGAYIGAGGLGQLIFGGIQNPGRMGNVLVVVGAVFVALLAIVSDFILGLIERLSTPRGLRAGGYP